MRELWPHLALGETVDSVQRGIEERRVLLSLSVEARVTDQCRQDGVPNLAVEGQSHL